MSIRAEFDSVANHYDAQRRKLIPCFDDFYGCAIDALELVDQIPHILDLGAGTGLMAQMVLEKYPLAKVDLIDLSEKMLAVAETRFKNNSNVSFHIGDYSTESFPHTYDAIVSSLSIHHLTDEDKVNLYKKVYDHLKASGIFINAEQVLGEDAYIEEKYRKIWEAQVEQSDLSAEEISAAYERVKLDKRTPLSLQLDWLKQAGFRNVTCLYKNYSFAVIFGRK